MTTKWQQQDPFADRESANYDNPIPSREFILQTLSEASAPLNRQQIANVFDLQQEEQIRALRNRLRAMERDGQLLFTRNKTYALVNKLNLIRGIVSAKRGNIGFVLPLDDSKEDVFLNAEQMHKVFDGDEVLVQISKVKHNRKLEGSIVEILNRAHPQIIGKCVIEDGIAMLQPKSSKINQQILLTPDQNYQHLVNKIIEVEISKWPTIHKPAIGKVLNVLGEADKPGIATDIAIRNFGLKAEFTSETMQEAQQISNMQPNDINRLDLRDLPFITIDGSDAKDFDDAVFCQSNRRGWQLYVAIADVSHYVKPNSALDKEAYERGNSVYFPNLVLPMLPEELSNDLCSLVPNQDRLVLVCRMQISRAGNLLDFTFHKAIIRSSARLTYDEVETFFTDKIPSDLTAKNSLNALYKMYKVLVKARSKRAALDFEMPEVKIHLNDNGQIANVSAVIRNDAHRLIEECMLLANVAAAKFLKDSNMPALYRIHPVPHPDKVANVQSFLSLLGLNLGKKNKTPTPQDYQKVLQATENNSNNHIIQTVLLRSLSQAIYSNEASAHFGLNYELYTHFTSPIRRYPDLLVHRAISSLINANKIDYPYDLIYLEKAAKHCSNTERTADEATREVMHNLKCTYMQQHVGEIFTGTISSVTNFGIFVELPNTLIEGLVHITNLPSDYYIFDQTTYCLIGERSGRKFKLGDTVNIQVAAVNMEDLNIDFILQEQ